MFGLSQVAHSPIDPLSPAYQAVEPSVVRYDYDPARAAQLLRDVGYTRGADGLVQDAAGQKLTFEVRAYAQIESQPKTMTAVADYWRQLGASVDELVVPNQLVADEQYRHTRPGFEVLTLGATGVVTNFHTSKIPLPANNFFGANRSRYSNPELDALIDQYTVTIPRPERYALLGQIVHHFTDQLVVMGMFYTTRHALTSKKMVNITERLSLGTEAWNAEQWDIK